MTTFTKLITPTALLAALTLAAAPSNAQQKYHGRENGSGQQQQQSGARGAERAQPRSEAPRAQAESPRPQGGAAPRVETRQETPRAQQPRPVETPRADNRGNDSRGNRANDNRGYENRGNDNRQGDNRRYDAGRAVPRVYAPRYEPRYSPRYSPRVYGPRSYYRPYVFRPRFSIGFGIFSGYPVPYTYSYPYPIEVYGYGAPRSVMITPGTSAYGGVALEITPYDADVWVDGEYAGKVQDFDGTEQPLTLTPGTHRIQVQAPGYEPMTVDVGIQAGQVVPYRGDLRPY
jgi:PEGA domain